MPVSQLGATLGPSQYPRPQLAALSARMAASLGDSPPAAISRVNSRFTRAASSACAAEWSPRGGGRSSP